MNFLYLPPEFVDILMETSIRKRLISFLPNFKQLFSCTNLSVLLNLKEKTNKF